MSNARLPRSVRSRCRKPASIMSAILDWCFRSRVTGRITIAQFPNAALWLFLAASLGAWYMEPGSIATVARTVAFGGGADWAADELLRGVNPWRRILGLMVLLFLLVDAAAVWT